MTFSGRRRWGVRRTGVAVVLAIAVGTMADSMTGPTTAWGQTAGPVRSAHAPPDTARAAGCTNALRLHRWRVRRLAEQTVVVPVEETNVRAASREVAAGAGGVILFGSQAPTDLGTELARLTSLAPAGIAPLVMTDEEGGTVQRMPNLAGSLPAARSMGRHWSAARIRSAARHLAVRMAAAHVTMDLAPVLDLDGRPGPKANDAIGTRSFSPRPAVATRDGLAFAHGLAAGGVIPVVKHFPGIGAADGNTDLGPASTPPWREVRGRDLRPFRAAIQAGLPAVMVSNARVPGLTRLPASLSGAAVHHVLRQVLGFKGLVLPDSLTAEAVTGAGFGLPRAAVRALSVGDDMVLFGAPRSRLWSTTQGVVNAVVSAVHTGDLSRSGLESAVGDVLSAKRVDLCAAR